MLVSLSTYFCSFHNIYLGLRALHLTIIIILGLTMCGTSSEVMLFRVQRPMHVIDTRLLSICQCH